jgi:hypothetical protein
MPRSPDDRRLERSLNWVAARHVITFAVIAVVLAFAVSSPGHPAFWIVLGSVAVVLGPNLLALAWLHGDTRRLCESKILRPSVE